MYIRYLVILIQNWVDTDKRTHLKIFSRLDLCIEESYIEHKIQEILGSGTVIVKASNTMLVFPLRGWWLVRGDRESCTGKRFTCPSISKRKLLFFINFAAIFKESGS